MKEAGANVTYVHQDHLTGTSVVSDSAGALVSSISYSPFGLTRSGNVPTSKKFTGQTLDDTGLYYYGARYYDPEIGRFISPDPIVQSYANPQSFNRYSYVLNNPLKYTDPTGLIVEFENEDDILASLDEYTLWGMDYAPGSPMDQMVQDWANNRLEWEALRESEPEYTKHMIDSEITFNIVDVDARSKTVSFFANMQGDVVFKEPVQIQFVRGGAVYDFMKSQKAGGISLYPGPIYIRTDLPISTERFTWLVAHESYHRWEQSRWGDGWVMWVSWDLKYIWESRQGTHDDWPSEMRANWYADRYYPEP